MRLIVLFLAGAPAALPQGLSFGVKAGVPLTEPFRTGSNGPLQYFSDTGTPSELKDDFRSGVVFGAGIEVHALILRLSPEIRYTRWGRDTFRDACCGGSLLSSSRNQGEFLLGLTF